MMKDLIMPKNGKTRFIFFSGKGGVGKSTMSCATAVWLAKNGHKTLIVTTDPAPNLSDIFCQEIGHNVTPIDSVENLFAVEIDPDTASEEYRERVIAPMRVLLDEKSLNVVKEQLNSPCVEEVAAFDKFIEYMNDPDYDVVVFDTAPTGHTLRLLELPGSWSAALGKNVSTCIGPGASLQSSKSRYDKAISYLQDSSRTTFIFVLRPENSSLLETKRSSDELSGSGINTDLLIINGILPEDACTDGFFKKKKEEEQAILKKIDAEFGNVRKIFYPLRDHEISGAKLLEGLGKFLYEGKIESSESFSNFEKDLKKPAFIKTQKGQYSLLTPLNCTRYIFFTGKGGVGKSTIACAVSTYLAEKGFRTLVITTDPASHLQSIFGQDIEHEPACIKGINDLFAARIDQKKALKEYKQRIFEEIKDVDDELKRSVEEDLNSPCAEEMAAFEKFMSYFELGGFDIIIFDTAPTGHTLRLLELPSDWKGFIDLGDLTVKTSDRTKNKYAGVIETMKNREKSTFVSVMYPEYTPVMEAWRASKELKKQVGIETGLIAVNFLLPKDYGKNNFFDNRRKQQEKYLVEIKKKFKCPMIAVPLLEREPEGLDNVRELGRIIFDIYK